MTSSSPTITSTDSGLSSSRVEQRARPSSARGTSSSRRGLRSRTFTARLRAPEPLGPDPGYGLLRASDLADLEGVAGLQLHGEHLGLRPANRWQHAECLRAGRDVEPAADAAAHPVPERVGRDATTMRAAQSAAEARAAAAAARTGGDQDRDSTAAIRPAGSRRWCCACGRGGGRAGTRARRRARRRRSTSDRPRRVLRDVGGACR